VDRVVCKGVPTESAVPYLAADRRGACSDQADRPNPGVVAWASVPGSERRFAQALTHNPLVIALSANYFKSYTDGVIGCRRGGIVNHAITLVAYNTNWQGPDGGWRDGDACSQHRPDTPPLSAICMRGVHVGALR
jgi:hypothetical protein